MIPLDEELMLRDALLQIWAQPRTPRFNSALVLQPCLSPMEKLSPACMAIQQIYRHKFAFYP